MASVAFLPWVRQGVAATITDPDSLGPAQPAAAAITAELAVNGASPPLTVGLQVRGPADVVGIDPREIVRMQPPPGTTDFEPNHLAYVEFDRPDLPWLFTPAAAGAQAQLRPWLRLVVVRVQDGVDLLGPGAGPLPALRISAPARPELELPDPQAMWCWAHAQVASGSTDPAAVHTALTGTADVSLSRLISPRLLVPDADYLACVVPAFELGRRSGLGIAVTDADLTGSNALAPAWSLSPAPATVTLPVYAHWHFGTGAGGDFAALAQRLRIQPATTLGSRPIDVGQPGFGLPPAVPPDTTVALGGALQPMTGPDTFTPWTGNAADAFRAALAPIVNAAGDTASTDPVLAPPLYGRWHAARATVAASTATWFDQLNLDPAYRSVAALGTRVVQDRQEELMAAAWEQAADLQAAGQRIRQLQLSLVVNTVLHARTFQRLPDDAAIRVAAPLFGRIHVSAAANTAGGGTDTLVARLNQSPALIQATSPVMRRVGRQRGPLSRRLTSQGATRSASETWIGRIFGEVLGTAAPIATLPPYALMTISEVRHRLPASVSLLAYSQVTADRVLSQGPLPNFHVVAEGQPVLPGHPPPGGGGHGPVLPHPPVHPVDPPVLHDPTVLHDPAVLHDPGLPTHPLGPSHGIDSPSAAAFRAAAAAHLARLNPGRPTVIIDPVHAMAPADIKATVLAQLSPSTTFVALAAAVASVGPNTVAPTVPATTAPAPGTVGIQTLLAAPVFHQPMYEPLRDTAGTLLLPGLQTVEANKVIGLKTNRPFIESYLLGLNVELGRELLWRGYPTDQRATSFDQFWDTRTSANPRPDIAPITDWGTNPLGGNSADPTVAEPFVLLVRSDLLRRYPNAIVYATRATVSGHSRVPSGEPADELLPAFRGSLPPDITFFGFELSVNDVVGDATHPGYYLVIQEHVGEPTFGLDVGTAPPGATHLDAAAPPPPGLPATGLQWGRNGAHVAGALRRRPVRIAIHASQLIATG